MKKIIGTVYFGSIIRGPKKALFDFNRKIAKSYQLDDDEINKLDKDKLIHFDLTETVRNIRTDKIGFYPFEREDQELGVIGDRNYGAYAIKLNVLPEKIKTNLNEANKDLLVIFPRFGLIDKRTDKGETLYAAPVILMKNKIDLMGDFELDY